jgi:hypothetical protein
MARASRTIRRTASVAALSALAVLDTAVANHVILPCGDECRGGGWVATGSMQSARELHTATLLPTGMVLVAGGRNAQSNALESAELYDPATASWSATAPMTVPRAGHTATLMADGRVVVAGGLGTEAGRPGPGPMGTTPTATAEIYDPATGTWTPTGSMSTGRFWYEATVLKDGRVLVAGGATPNLVTSDSAELYDPATGRWIRTGDLNVARYGHTLTLLDDGTVLAARGSDSGDLEWTLSSAERYDPRTGTWSLTGNTGVGSVGHTASLLADGRVLVAGGYSGGVGGGIAHVVTMLFDPATGAWSRAGDLLEPRYNHAATVLPGGEVLVAGGVYLMGGYPALSYHLPLPSERYGPDTTTWRRAADLAEERGKATMTLLADGTVLVAGGFVVGPDYGNVPIASAERYVTPNPLRERLVVEYFHAVYDHYFMTADEPEIAVLDAAAERSWGRTGKSFTIFDPSVSPYLALVPVCRFWSGQSFAPESSHFYTPYADECVNVLQDAVWTYERIAFHVAMPGGMPGARTCPSGTRPLYRAYNGGRGGAPNHRYTTDPAVLDAMIALGWVMEGEAVTRVFACVPLQK